MKKLFYCFCLLFSVISAQAQTPAIIMVIDNSISNYFHCYISTITENTDIQVDLGNGVLTNFTVGNYDEGLSGTTVGNTIKIYGSGIKSLHIDGFKNYIALDITGATELKDLRINQNKITNLDLSKNTLLTFLSCSDNQLATLDLSNNTALTYLDCSKNLLTTINLTNVTILESLKCSYNLLKNLDVSQNTRLKTLYCNNNLLKTLDINKNTVLNYLICSFNELVNLNASQNNTLKVLNCDVNNLTLLDISGATSLNELSCYSNHLTSLDISKNIFLNYLSLGSNEFTFNTLPINSNLQYYGYCPQKSYKLSKTDFELDEPVDLSNFYDSHGHITSYVWKCDWVLYTTVYYYEKNGIFRFQTNGNYIYCQMTNASFPGLILETEKINIIIPATSIEENTLKFNIFPNPITDNLSIKSEESIIKVEIYTITGVKVYELIGNNSNALTLPTADLPKGMLIVKVFGRNGVVEKKILKE